MTFHIYKRIGEGQYFQVGGAWHPRDAEGIKQHLEQKEGAELIIVEGRLAPKV